MTGVGGVSETGSGKVWWVVVLRSGAGEGWLTSQLQVVGVEVVVGCRFVSVVPLVEGMFSDISGGDGAVWMEEMVFGDAVVQGLEPWRWRDIGRLVVEEVAWMGD